MAFPTTLPEYILEEYINAPTFAQKEIARLALIYESLSDEQKAAVPGILFVIFADGESMPFSNLTNLKEDLERQHHVVKLGNDIVYKYAKFSTECFSSVTNVFHVSEKPTQQK